MKLLFAIIAIALTAYLVVVNRPVSIVLLPLRDSDDEVWGHRVG